MASLEYLMRAILKSEQLQISCIRTQILKRWYAIEFQRATFFIAITSIVAIQTSEFCWQIDAKSAPKTSVLLEQAQALWLDCVY